MAPDGRRNRIDGRGTRRNPANRYEQLHIDTGSEVDPALDLIADSAPTLFYRDTSRTILAENESPDLGFRFSLNPYRGCEHGCIYCYARPSHEYLSFSAGLDFERRIMVKTDAPVLLRRAFESPRWQPTVVALSGNTDCYQPVERRLELTRRCLEVFRDFLNPVVITTKSALITRDVDLLNALAASGAVHVTISIATLDPDLARRLEPRAATPERRLETIATLAAAGIPAAVLLAPTIPGLTDHELPEILRRAAAAGARSAAWALLRLPAPVDTLFADWLDRHHPGRRDRVLGRLRECRDGALNDTAFGRRMSGSGIYADHIADLFRVAARRIGLDQHVPHLTTTAFRRPPRSGQQLALC